MAEAVHATVTAENASRTFKEVFEANANMSDCLCARALREATGESWLVGTTLAWRGNYMGAVYDIDPDTTRRIYRWMDGRDVGSFDFTITMRERGLL